MKKIYNKTKNEKGFTLVELIIVIAILAVIAGIAAPNLIGNINNSRKKADVANASLIANTIMQAIGEKDEFASITLTTTAREFVKDSTDTDVKDLFNYAFTKLQVSEMKLKFDSGKSFYVTVENGKVVVYDGPTIASAAKLYPVPDAKYTN